MDTQKILLTLAVVVVGVIVANYVGKKFLGMGNWEENYEEE